MGVYGQPFLREFFVDYQDDAEGNAGTVVRLALSVWGSRRGSGASGSPATAGEDRGYGRDCCAG
jgi:hypothetical protein